MSENCRPQGGIFLTHTVHTYIRLAKFHVEITGRWENCK